MGKCRVIHEVISALRDGTFRIRRSKEYFENSIRLLSKLYVYRRLNTEKLRKKNQYAKLQLVNKMVNLHKRLAVLPIVYMNT